MMDSRDTDAVCVQKSGMVFDDLPFDICVRILDLLPATDVVFSQGTSRRWLDLARESLKNKEVVDLLTINGKKGRDALAWVASTPLLPKMRTLMASGTVCSEGLSKVLESMIQGEGHQQRGYNLNKLQRLLIDSCKSLTNNLLSQFMGSMPFLVTLKLPNCSQLSDAAAAHIAIYCPQLQALDCTNWTNLTDNGLKYISLYCKDLRTLVADGCLKIGAEGVASISQFCRKLEYLSLVKCCRVNDLGLLPLGQHPSLQSLNLSRCFHVRRVQLLKDAPRLTSLNFAGLSTMQDEDLEELLQAVGRQLTSLALQSCVALTGTILSTISRVCSNLKHLDLGRMSLEDQDLAYLTHISQGLQFLGLSWCTSIQGEGLQAVLTNSPLLQDLDVEAVYLLGDGLLHSLQRCCTLLQSLNIRMCHLLSAEAIVNLVREVPMTSLRLSGILDEAGTKNLVRELRAVRPSCQLHY